MMDLKIDYNEQMLNYYPEVIKSIREFQVLINTQSLQVEEMHEELTKILGNAYLIDSDETRLKQWEDFLGITPSPQGDDNLETWLADRREVILARLYHTPKLNTKSIAEIVKIFTGGTSVSYFKDGTIHVLISPPKDNKAYKFENVEQELRKKVPAHLMFQVDRNYYNWLQIRSNHSTWGDVKSDFTNWNEVLFAIPVINDGTYVYESTAVINDYIVTVVNDTLSIPKDYGAVVDDGILILR
jgi:hypothetical protein